MATWNLTFAQDWEAEILERLPLIGPSRQYVYPKAVEEVERGALLLHVRAGVDALAAPFLAIFALGFAAPSLPHGVWACPNPEQLCAVAGGYAYILNTRQPERWQQISYRPVTAIYVAVNLRLLIFVGFHTLCAWGEQGLAWETERLSWEGLRFPDLDFPGLENRGGETIGEKKTEGLGSGQLLNSEELSGLGWEMATDTEIPFTVDLRTGQHSGGAFGQPKV